MSAPSDTDTEVWTLGRLLQWTWDYLARNGVEEPRLSAEVLLAEALSCRRIDLYTRYAEVPDAEVVNRFRDWVKRAGGGEPIAYLVGVKEFFSLPFTVTPDVLIPRPETETLVECVLDHCQDRGWDEPYLCDVGTGSGCISVALLTHLPRARAVATDSSPGALEVARENARRHGVAGRILFAEADRLSLPASVVPEGGFDVLVSNPPYVPAADMASLHASVREHEPRAALTDGEDGLSFYREIATNGARLTARHGSVFVEVGDGQAASVIEVMERAGIWKHNGTRRDRIVGADRVLCFTRVDA